MNIVALSIICFFIGILSKKRLTERRLVFNTVESYPVEYKRLRYKSALGNKSEKFP